MGIKIPGWLVSLLTFPGVILHEWAHKKFCDLAKVKVQDVVYFNLDFIGENESAGYVIHERPTTYKQIFLISVGPLIINSLATILLGYLFQILGFNTPETQNSLLAIILAWLALSVGMHAFPSDEDMKNILEASKVELAKGGSKLHYLAFPFVWLVSLANKLRAIWFDAIYAGLLMMLGTFLASLNISLILFVLLAIVILSFSFLFLLQSNLQSSIVKVGIILIVLLNLFYLLRTTDWYKNKVIEFKAKRFIAEVRKEMKEKSSKGLSTYGIVDDVYERMLKSDPDAKKIVAKVNEILKKEKTQKINKIKKTYKKDFLKAVELALKEKGYSNLYQYFVDFYNDYLSEDRENVQLHMNDFRYSGMINFIIFNVLKSAIGNPSDYVSVLKFYKLLDDKFFGDLMEAISGKQKDIKFYEFYKVYNFTSTERNIFIYLTTYYLVIENAVKDEDLETLSQAGFAINSKKSFVDQLTSKIKEGIDIIENIKIDQTSELEIKVREIFNNLANKGYFKNSEQSFNLLFPLLQIMVKGPNGKIPSWFFFANWQINYLDESVDSLRLAQIYSEEFQKREINMDVRDVLDGIHARTFDDIYLLSKHGILHFILPDPDISTIKDARKRSLTENWIASVYRGYKLMKKEPPFEIKILYNSLTKDKVEAQNIEIIEDIHGKLEEINQNLENINQILEDQEPEVYTIENPFLKK
jgi:hypothetical protein